MRRWAAAALLLGLLPLRVQAQDQAPRFCPTRPSLGESACTTEPGHVHLEVSALDWERDDDGSTRQDTVLLAPFQARLGLTDTAELQVAWTPFGHVRTRDKATGLIDRVGRVGDLQIGLRRNLRHPDGKGLSFGIEPSVTLPVGRSPVSQGTWSAGVVLPVTYDLSDRLNLALTSELDAAADEDGSGRHLAAIGTLGLSYELSERLTGVAEIQVLRDDDPAGHTTQPFAAGSLAWQPRHGLQFDVLVGAGLNEAAPDIRVLTGGAVLF